MPSRPGRFVTRYTGTGQPYRVYEVLMPAISPNLVHSTVYLYPDVGEANAGRRTGGTGFLLGIKMPNGIPPYVYAVTNKHVVERGCHAIRVNTIDGQTMAIQTQLDAWTTAVNDDLAVMPFHVAPSHAVRILDDTMLISEDCKIGAWPIWPGDEVFFFGRFITHDGEQRNKPIVRSGMISMLPDTAAPVRMPGNREQIAFLVEGKSLSGFSGSPAFVQLAQPRWTSPADGDQNLGWIPQEIISLLGVDCGHQPFWSPVFEDDRETRVTPPQWTEANSGMAVVVPAWKLRALLDLEELRQERDEWARAVLKGEQTASQIILDTTK
jgi:hypothetical protein